ncbi:MAG: protein dehydratase [Candidatus Dadabacteria bacterium]|nr:MAG: protein dehydratase [Candidatus Dadabacteria bacterium]
MSGCGTGLDSVRCSGRFKGPGRAESVLHHTDGGVAMSVSPRMLRYQLPVIKALGRTVAAAAIPARKGAAPSTPGREISETVPPRSNELVDAYVAWAGAAPDKYRDRIPPHMFPQWGFPALTRTLEGLPYPMAKVLNQGCAMTINGDIPRGAPLQAVARLESVDEDERRVRIHQRLTTGPRQQPDALIADVYAVIPKKRGGGGKKQGKEPDWTEAGRFDVRSDDGRNFAFLTGDLNPIHWIPPMARLSGFKRPILHGFGTLARTFEIIEGPDGSIEQIDVRFVRPLIMPQTVIVERAAAQIRARGTDGTVFLAGTISPA